MSLEDAIATLRSKGVVFSLPPTEHLAISTVAKRLDCSKDWVRDHLKDFPHRWRMPGGEWRIPASDVEALAASRRAQA